MNSAWNTCISIVAVKSMVRSSKMPPKIGDLTAALEDAKKKIADAEEQGRNGNFTAEEKAQLDEAIVSSKKRLEVLENNLRLMHGIMVEVSKATDVVKDTIRKKK